MSIDDKGNFSVVFAVESYCGIRCSYHVVK